MLPSPGLRTATTPLAVVGIVRNIRPVGLGLVRWLAG
jgi:hypothetical protein